MVANPSRVATVFAELHTVRIPQQIETVNDLFTLNKNILTGVNL